MKQNYLTVFCNKIDTIWLKYNTKKKTEKNVILRKKVLIIPGLSFFKLFKLVW